MSTQKVCITGASGFIASHIVQQCLSKGYIVHGTVRDANNAAKTKHLLELPNAITHLKLFSADLADVNTDTGEASEKLKETLTQAFDGCETIMHTATPVKMGAKDGKKEIYEPGMAGIKAVLNLLATSSSLKTFVFTSSMSAIAPQPEPDVKTEEHWSDAEQQKSKGSWYGACKTDQERLLWKLTESQEIPSRIRCVAICPTAVFGPMLQAEVNTTCGWGLSLFKDGKNSSGGTASDDSMSVVDVRDCAAQHIAAMENVNATGRYMCISGDRLESDGPNSTLRESTHWNNIFKLVKELYPKMPDVKPSETMCRPTRFDMQRAHTLIPLDQWRSMREVLADLLQEGQKRGILE